MLCKWHFCAKYKDDIARLARLREEIVPQVAAMERDNDRPVPCAQWLQGTCAEANGQVLKHRLLYFRVITKYLITTNNLICLLSVLCFFNLNYSIVFFNIKI